MKKTANRCGLNMLLSKYTEMGKGDKVMNIKYANSVAIDISSDTTYATGGQRHANQVGFDEPITGTFAVEAQIVPIEFIGLAASEDLFSEATEILAMETVKCKEEGKITLSESPVDGTLFVVEAGGDVTGETLASSATEKVVTITGATVGKKYDCYYMRPLENGKTVTFNNNNALGYYILEGLTQWVASDGTKEAEYIVGHKLRPQRKISITYQGTGDPLSLTMTFDVLENEDGETVSFTRG